MTLTERNPLRGMPADLRREYDGLPAHVRQAYLDWWTVRQNHQAAHRDTWPAFVAGWRARDAYQPPARRTRRAP